MTLARAFPGKLNRVFGSRGGHTLPRSGLVWTGPVDTIGLSANALWDALPSYMRSIYLSDRDTLKAAATIAANVADSGFLNVGGGLFGNETKGYAQYQAGTSTDILDKAARYYKETYGWPTDIKSLVIASGGDLASPIGPTVAYSAAAGQVPDGLGGVQNSTSAPVHSSGYYGGPAYTNLFGSSDSPAAARTKTLTAQKYCLQVKTGSATCSYGTATPSSPLQFTASAGDTTFTPTGVDDWCLTASGGYVFMAIPYGQSTVSTFGTTTGNGVSVPLTGSDKADRLIECFSGVPDGVELVANGSFATDTVWQKETGWSINTTTGKAEAVAGTASSLYQEIATAIGDRCLLVVDVVLTAGNIAVRFGNNTDQYTISTSGIRALEITDQNDGFLKLYKSSTFAGTVDNVSVQKLSPAVGTVAVLMKMGAGSAELPVDNRNVLSIDDLRTQRIIYYVDSSGVKYISSTWDGTSYVHTSASTPWDRNEYHLKVVEFNGTKFRVGNQRYNESGTAIDADIVWSHATLAGGATFDGSFNPTTFLRWALNNSVPSWMKAHFVSNQAGLGNAEIIRRLRKYGKF